VLKDIVTSFDYNSRENFFNSREKKNNSRENFFSSRVNCFKTTLRFNKVVVICLKSHRCLK